MTWIGHWRERGVYYRLETHTNEDGDVFLGMRKIGKVEPEKIAVELPELKIREVELSKSK